MTCCDLEQRGAEEFRANNHHNTSPTSNRQMLLMYFSFTQKRKITMHHATNLSMTRKIMKFL
jgi:hypothetical protein